MENLKICKISSFQLQEAELYAAAIVGTASRFQNADFASAWMSSPFSILIPVPKSSTNVRALIEPMSTEVGYKYC
jgi:ionotropic glutamate receptor